MNKTDLVLKAVELGLGTRDELSAMSKAELEGIVGEAPVVSDELIVDIPVSPEDSKVPEKKKVVKVYDLVKAGRIPVGTREN